MGTGESFCLAWALGLLTGFPAASGFLGIAFYVVMKRDSAAWRLGSSPGSILDKLLFTLLLLLLLLLLSPGGPAYSENCRLFMIISFSFSCVYTLFLTGSSS
jgi:hypothetical protein